MLIRPWDAAIDATEWQQWLAETDHFGLLAVNNLDPACAPVVVPTHFAPGTDGDLLVHLARPNPVWPHLEAAAETRLALVGDYAYIPTNWRAMAGGPEEDGVPTSYYSAVQFVCRPAVVDDPAGKAEILTAQLDHFQPEGRHAVVDPDSPPYGPLLAGIRALRLKVLGVDAKFKYDDHNPVEHRLAVIERLEGRNRGLDLGAAGQQRRRLAEIGEWRTRAQRE